MGTDRRISACVCVRRNKGDACRYTGKIRHGKEERERAWSLFVVVSSTLLLMVIIFPPHQYHNRRIKLIVICHPLFVKQLLLNGFYVLSSAVKRSCFFHGLQNAFQYEHSSMQRSPHQKCFLSVVSIMAKKAFCSLFSPFYLIFLKW